VLVLAMHDAFELLVLLELVSRKKKRNCERSQGWSAWTAADPVEANRSQVEGSGLSFACLHKVFGITEAEKDGQVSTRVRECSTAMVVLRLL
jgi:hypothetical protein